MGQVNKDPCKGGADVKLPKELQVGLIRTAARGELVSKIPKTMWVGLIRTPVRGELVQNNTQVALGQVTKDPCKDGLCFLIA